MKLALLADIHANYPALEAVAAHIAAWQPDEVILAGDVINRGPSPKACLDFVVDKVATSGWKVIKGNHEDYVLDWLKPEAHADPFHADLHQISYWTWEQLYRSPEPFRIWPDQISVQAPDGTEVRCVHASVRNNRDSIWPITPLADMRLKIGPNPPSTLLVGHTHIPLVRCIDNTLVVNCGSVGMPFDRDTRASYAQLVWQHDAWYSRIVRVDYDRAQTEHDYSTSGYLALPMAELTLRELREGRSQLFEWTEAYQKAILDRTMTVRESVRLQLQRP